MDSGLGEFFQQIPVGFILMFCGSGILLVFSLGYIVSARARRARGAQPQTDAAASPTPAAVEAGDFADLPDLDVLAGAFADTPPAQATPAAPVPRPAGAHPVSLTGGETVEAVEVLTVLRDVSEGGLIVRIGDKSYRNPPALADAEFKRRFHSTLRDLNAAQQPVEAKTKTAPTEVPLEEAAVAPSAKVEMPSIGAAEPIPGDLPKFKLPDAPPAKPKRGQRPVAEPIPEINIAGSIESFLQHKLTRTPQYSTRSIHVRPAPHGGVKIEVDGMFYETVAEVEDSEVRQFLTTTIEEWQARQ